MYKFRICVKNNATGKIEEGLMHKKTDSLPSLEIGETVSYTINAKGTIKTRKGFKAPKLEELYAKLFNDDYLTKNAHNGAADVNATARCFFELIRQSVISIENSTIQLADISDFNSVNNKIISLSDIDLGPTQKLFQSKNQSHTAPVTIDKNHDSSNKEHDVGSFCHIRCHSSYSLLQSTISVKALIDRTISCGFKSVGLTDHGNLFGAFEFLSLCAQNDITPMLGSEFYLVDDRMQRQFTREKKG